MFTAEYFDPTNDLLERRTALSMQNEILDMAKYALAWERLAADFSACGLVSNAEYCRSRGRHYGAMAGGEYIKLVEGPLSEIIQVSDESIQANQIAAH